MVGLFVACTVINVVPLLIHGLVSIYRGPVCQKTNRECMLKCDTAPVAMYHRQVYPSTIYHFYSVSKFGCRLACDNTLTSCLIPVQMSTVGAMSLICFLFFQALAYPVYYAIRTRRPIQIATAESILSHTKVNCPHCLNAFISNRIDPRQATGVRDPLFCPSCNFLIAGIA